MADSDDDQTWVTQSRNGDHAAFEALIQKHQQMIHTLTFRMTGSLADCKDLAQETFVRAYRQLDSFNGTAKFSSWLYRIAVNACLDWRRQEQRRERLLHNWSETSLPHSKGEVTDSDELRHGTANHRKCRHLVKQASYGFTAR